MTCRSKARTQCHLTSCSLVLKLDFQPDCDTLNCFSFFSRVLVKLVQATEIKLNPLSHSNVFLEFKQKCFMVQIIISSFDIVSDHFSLPMSVYENFSTCSFQNETQMAINSNMKLLLCILKILKTEHFNIPQERKLKEQFHWGWVVSTSLRPPLFSSSLENRANLYDPVSSSIKLNFSELSATLTARPH